MIVDFMNAKSSVAYPFLHIFSLKRADTLLNGLISRGKKLLLHKISTHNLTPLSNFCLLKLN